MRCVDGDNSRRCILSQISCILPFSSILTLPSITKYTTLVNISSTSHHILSFKLYYSLYVYILQNDRLILLNSRYELEADKYVELGSIGGWSQMPPMRDERAFVYELEDTNTVYQIHIHLKEVRILPPLK